MFIRLLFKRIVYKWITVWRANGEKSFYYLFHQKYSGIAFKVFRNNAYFNQEIILTTVSMKKQTKVTQNSKYITTLTVENSRNCNNVLSIVLLEINGLKNCNFVIARALNYTIYQVPILYESNRLF